MSADLDNLHELIVRETFSALSSQDGVVLVGILHLFRVTFSREFRSLASRAFNWEPLFLEPLELTAAARLVAPLTPVKASALLRDFREHWATLRCSPRLKALTEQLESHRLVNKLVPYWQSSSGMQVVDI